MNANRTGILTAAVRTLLLAVSAGGLANLGACAGHGESTTKAAEAGNLRMAAVKSGVEYQIALEQFLSGELVKATRTCESAIGLNPMVGKSHVLRGRIMIERGELESARASLLRAEEVDPKSFEAQYYLGIVHERFSQPEEALQRYLRAVNLDPTSAQYIVAAAEMYVQLKRFDEADQLIATPSDSLANNAAIRQTAGNIALLKGEPDRAVQLFGQARLLAPDDPSVVEDLVRAQMAARKYGDAEFNISVLLREKANANRRDLRHWRAEALAAMNRMVEARSVLDELTSDEAGQSDLQAWLALGRVAAALSDQHRLRQAAQRVIVLAPARSDGYVMKAMNLRAVGELPGALSAAETAVSLDGESSTPRLLRALILRELGRDDEAAKSLSEVLERHPAHAAAQRLRADIERTVAVALAE